jgi:hypothetical protein
MEPDSNLIASSERQQHTRRVPAMSDGDGITKAVSPFSETVSASRGNNLDFLFIPTNDRFMPSGGGICNLSNEFIALNDASMTFPHIIFLFF